MADPIPPFWIRDALKRWAKRVSDTCLKGKLTVYFPSKCEKCPLAIEKIEDAMIEAFGGYTEWDAFGCGITGEEEAKNPPPQTKIRTIEKKGKKTYIACEPVKVIESITECVSKEAAEAIEKTLAEAVVEAKQNWLFIGKDNNYFFISKEKLIPLVKEEKLKL